MSILTDDAEIFIFTCEVAVNTQFMSDLAESFHRCVGAYKGPVSWLLPSLTQDENDIIRTGKISTNPPANWRESVKGIVPPEKKCPKTKPGGL